MQLKRDDEKLLISLKYDSSREMKKTIGQFRVRMYLKALTKQDLINEPVIDKEELSAEIQCNNKQIYHNILKGLKSQGK